MHESSMFGISSKWSLLVDVELEKRISTGFCVVSSATNSAKVTPGSDVFNHWSRRCSNDGRCRRHVLDHWSWFIKCDSRCGRPAEVTSGAGAT